jgi:hypothetical protein
LLGALCLGSEMSGIGQTITVTIKPPSSDYTVRLLNIVSRDVFSGDNESTFTVPAGAYSMQLLREGVPQYQEARFLGSDESVNLFPMELPPRSDQLKIGLGRTLPYRGDACSALLLAAQVALGTYGVEGQNLAGRIGRAGIQPNCGSYGLPALSQILNGSYGNTSIGRVSLHIQPSEYSIEAITRDLEAGIPEVIVSGSSAFPTCGVDVMSRPLFCSPGGALSSSELLRESPDFITFVLRISIVVQEIDEAGLTPDSWVTFADADTLAETENRLSAASASITSTFQRRVASLPRVTSSAHSNLRNFVDSESFSSQAIAQLIDLTHHDISDALKQPRLSALKSHYDAQFAQVQTPSGRYTTRDAAEEIIGQVFTILSSLKSVSNDLSVDLVFKSEPEETEGAELTLTSCVDCPPLFSQGGIHRLYRGLYDYEVIRKGYIPYRSPKGKPGLDLVDDTGTLLVCGLVPVAQAESADSRCSLQTK